MRPQRAHHFTLHELLVIAALAALGGVSGSAVSWIGASVRAITGLPGNLQFMAGIHILWLVLAVGLIRKPGAATATGVLKGAVELLSGNPHGVIVVLMSALGGFVVDIVWVLAGRRDRLVVYLLAGGFGAASNLLIFRLIVALPDHRAVTMALAALTLVAFVSGMLLAGLLAWSLMDVLRRVGAAGAPPPRPARRPAWRMWLGIAAVCTVLVSGAMGFFFSAFHNTARAVQDAPVSPTPVETARAP